MAELSHIILLFCAISDSSNTCCRFFRECLAFATEPVFASLANILGNHDNMGVISKELEEYKMYEVEIKYGLLQVNIELDCSILFMRIFYVF